MSIPRQIRLLLKAAVAAALLGALALGLWVRHLRLRVRKAQALYESVEVGDAWNGLEGFVESRVESDPVSRAPALRRYRCNLMALMPICWEIAVDEKGQVAGKYRYD